MMRLLFVTGLFPFPADFGLAMRTSAVLRALAEMGHEIHLISFGKPGDEHNPEAQQHCRSLTIVPRTINNLSGLSDISQRLRYLPCPVPYGTHRFRSELVERKITEALHRREFDALVCDTLDCIVNVPCPCPVPLVLNSHNIEHLILKRYLNYESQPARWLYAALEMRKLRWWEQRSFSRAQMVLVCSEHDSNVLSRMCPGTTSAVVPNVIDVSAYVPADSCEPATVLYTGGMDWYPNRDAVQFFVSAILPRIRERVPHAKFVVAGRNPSPEFRARFAHVRDMEFTGTVADMRPVIARATLCVVPLRIGSGTRLKILEAAAMAKPVVSTQLGAEGLNFTENEEIRLADSPEASATATIDLLSHPKRREQVGKAARRRVEESYSFAVLKSSLDKAMQCLVTSPPVSGAVQSRG